MTYTRLIPLPGTHNLRDLGGYRASEGQTAWRQLLRADSLHRLEKSGMRQLRNIGCTTVIDLRHGDETAFQPNPFALSGEGVEYHNIALFQALDPTQPTICEAPDLLLALYCEALKSCAPAVVGVMQIIANAPGTVLFHCTAGKDRTGLIAAFLLLLAGTPRQEIIDDYAATAAQAPAMFAALQAEVEAAGRTFDLESPLLLSNAQTMAAFLDHIQATYGSGETYLRTSGLSGGDIHRLRNRLLQNSKIEGAA